MGISRKINLWATLFLLVVLFSPTIGFGQQNYFPGTKASPVTDCSSKNTNDNNTACLAQAVTDLENSCKLKAEEYCKKVAKCKKGELAVCDISVAVENIAVKNVKGSCNEADKANENLQNLRLSVADLENRVNALQEDPEFQKLTKYTQTQRLNALRGPLNAAQKALKAAEVKFVKSEGIRCEASGDCTVQAQNPRCIPDPTQQKVGSVRPPGSGARRVASGGDLGRPISGKKLVASGRASIPSNVYLLTKDGKEVSAAEVLASGKLWDGLDREGRYVVYSPDGNKEVRTSLKLAAALRGVSAGQAVSPPRQRVAAPVPQAVSPITAPAGRSVSSGQCPSYVPGCPGYQAATPLPTGGLAPSPAPTTRTQ
jgi:hypothetical protein